MVYRFIEIKRTPIVECINSAVQKRYGKCRDEERLAHSLYITSSPSTKQWFEPLRANKYRWACLHVNSMYIQSEALKPSMSHANHVPI